MSDDTPKRRWEDTQHEIQHEAQIQVAQVMTPYRLTLERLDRHVEELRATVYGRPELRQQGIIDRLEQFEAKIKSIDLKLDTLLDESRDRSNQILGARKAFYVLAAVVTLFGGPAAISAALKAFGITP